MLLMRLDRAPGEICETEPDGGATLTAKSATRAFLCLALFTILNLSLDYHALTGTT